MNQKNTQLVKYRNWSFLIIVFAFLVLLTGCASEINQRNATRYMIMGTQAQASGDWDGARRAYARAAVNGELAGLPAETQAMFAYEYGRSTGVTCFFDHSETWLNKAYELDKKAGQPLYFSLDELGRLMLAQAKYTQAAGYFERGIAELNKVEFFNKSPSAAIAYADLLDDYELALLKSGAAAEAGNIKKRASEIRSKYPNQESSTERTPYGKYCTNQQTSK